MSQKQKQIQFSKQSSLKLLQHYCTKGQVKPKCSLIYYLKAQKMIL